MEIRRTKKPKLEINLSNDIPLSFYNSCPIGIRSIDDIKNSVFNRLAIYKSVEKMAFQTSNRNSVSRDIMSLLYNSGIDDATSDLTSHLIFRIACCQNDYMRKVFLKTEEAIFRARYSMTPETEKSKFLNEHGISFDIIPQEEMSYLIKAKRIIEPIPNSSEQIYYKVPFKKVLSLVSYKKVFLQKGYAFVPKASLNSVVFAKFKSSLSKKLAETLRALHFNKIEERIKPLIHAISSWDIFAENTFENVSGSISIGEIEDLAKNSFPLCMRNSYEHLKSDSHLKHSARMHLSLFLKSAGLPFKEAMQFWRKNFSKKTDSAKFDSLYSYFIKHNYGKVGSKVSYDPYSCAKIINTIPNSGDHCGCPFKIFNEREISIALKQYKLNNDAQKEIKGKYLSGDYQLACGLLLSHTHPKINRNEIQIDHPNSYFELALGRKKN